MVYKLLLCEHTQQGCSSETQDMKIVCTIAYLMCVVQCMSAVIMTVYMYSIVTLSNSKFIGQVIE